MKKYILYIYFIYIYYIPSNWKKEVNNVIFLKKGECNSLERISKLIKFPAELVDRIEQYKEDNHLSTFTSALLELIRKGLDTQKESN